MDQADDELRVTIQHIWPLQAKKMLDLLIPRNAVLNSGKLTVGKIYAGLLILESWRNTKFGQIDSGLPVSAPPKLKLTHSPVPYKYLITIIINPHNHCLDRILRVVISIIKIFCKKSAPEEIRVGNLIDHGKTTQFEISKIFFMDFLGCF